MINYKTDHEIQLVRVRERSATQEPTVKSAITGREAAKDEELLVHDWRVAQAGRTGSHRAAAGGRRVRDAAASVPGNLTSL
jgi:hypothetical protein